MYHGCYGLRKHVFFMLLAWASALSSCQGRSSGGATFEEMMAMGDQHLLTGEIGGAIAQYEQAIHLMPRSSEAHFRLGVAYDQQWLRSFEEARRRFIEDSVDRTSQGSKPEPSHDKHAPYARYGENTKAKEQSLAAFKEAVRLDLRNWRARYYVAMDYLNRKQYPEAIVEFQNIVEINDKYANAYGGMATAYREAGQLTLAIEAYKKALILDPTDAHARLDLGLAYIQIGDRTEAVKELEYLKRASSIFAEWLEREMAAGR